MEKTNRKCLFAHSTIVSNRLDKLSHEQGKIEPKTQ